MIENNYAPATHGGNDTATAFTIPFYFQEASWIHAAVVENGTSVELEATAFSVDGAGNDSGGTLTYPLSGAPLTTTQKIVIWRETPLSQEQDWGPASAYNPPAIGDGDDKLTMMAQELRADIDRCPKVGREAEATPDELMAAINAAAATASSAASSAGISEGNAAGSASAAQAAATAAAASAASAPTPEAEKYLRGATGGGWEGRSVAQVLADIGAAPASHTHTKDQITDLSGSGGAGLPTQSIVECKMTGGSPDFLKAITTGVELVVGTGGKFRVAAGDGPGSVREGEWDGTGTAPGLSLANSGTALGFAAFGHTAARSKHGVASVGTGTAGTIDVASGPPWRMFDGSAATFLSAVSLGADEEAYIVYEFNLPQSINGLRMTGRSDGYWMLRSREFRVVADGVAVGTFTDPLTESSKDFDFSGTFTAKKWEFYLKPNNNINGGGYPGYCQPSQITFKFASNEFTTAKHYLCADVAESGAVSLHISTTAPTFGAAPVASEDYFDISLNTMKSSTGTQLWRVPIAIVEAASGILCANQFWPGVYALLDVNGGEDVAPNTAYEEPGPFFGPRSVRTEVFYNSKWGDSGDFYSGTAYGVKCSHSDDESETIRVGNYTVPNGLEGFNELSTTTAVSTPVPVRRHVRRMF